MEPKDNREAMEALNTMRQEKARAMLDGYKAVREVFIAEFEAMDTDPEEDLSEIVL